MQGDHYMAKKHVLGKTIISIVERYGKELHEKKIPYSQLIVFGSQAKGLTKPWSDIDLCVVSNTFGKNRHTERVRLLNVRNNSLLDIEPHPYHPKDLEEKYDPLAAEIKKYGIYVA